jgi:hypothetical protein
VAKSRVKFAWQNPARNLRGEIPRAICVEKSRCNLRGEITREVRHSTQDELDRLCSVSALSKKGLALVSKWLHLVQIF